MTASLPVPAFLFTSFWTLEASRSSNLYGGSNGGLVSFSQTLPFFRKDEVAFTPRIRSFKYESELQNDALRAVSGEFIGALESAKEYKKRVENAYKKG